jgi:hypothetical protein
MPNLIIVSSVLRGVLKQTGPVTLRVPQDCWALDVENGYVGPVSLSKTCVCAKGWRSLFMEADVSVYDVNPLDRGTLAPETTRVVIVTTPRSVPPS